jgi:hypothetical protein
MKTENEGTGEVAGKGAKSCDDEKAWYYNTLNTLWFDTLTLLARERGESATSQLVNSPHLTRSRSRTELTLYLRIGENYSDFMFKKKRKRKGITVC